MELDCFLFFNPGTDPSPRGSADSNGAASTGTGVSANNGLKATSSSVPAVAVPVMTNVSGIPGGGGSRRPSLSNEVLNHVASSECKATVRVRKRMHRNLSSSNFFC